MKKEPEASGTLPRQCLAGHIKDFNIYQSETGGLVGH